MNEDIKIYKHKDDGIWFATKDGIVYDFDASEEYRLRRILFVAHINWDSFLTEYEEIRIDEMPIYLQDVLGKECVRGVI